MTIGQVQEFLAAVERHERRQHLGAAIAARMAQADGKAWKDFTRSLRRGS